MNFVAVTSLEPGFVSPLENITVAAGRSAHFTCVVNHLGGHKVENLTRSSSLRVLIAQRGTNHVELSLKGISIECLGTFSTYSTSYLLGFLEIVFGHI